MIDDIIKYLEGYLKQNESLEEFTEDINNFGGMFKNGWLEVDEKYITVLNNGFSPVCKIRTALIWNTYQNKQAKLKINQYV